MSVRSRGWAQGRLGICEKVSRILKARRIDSKRDVGTGTDRRVSDRDHQLGAANLPGIIVKRHRTSINQSRGKRLRPIRRVGQRSRIRDRYETCSFFKFWPDLCWRREVADFLGIKVIFDRESARDALRIGSAYGRCKFAEDDGLVYSFLLRHDGNTGTCVLQ